MGWSEIKKAINSNLEIPLNILIGNTTDNALNQTLFGKLNKNLTPNQAKLYQTSTTANTYYTVLNVTSSTAGGECSRITLLGSASNLTVYNIRITIDGGTPIIISQTSDGSPNTNFEAGVQGMGIGIMPNLNAINYLQRSTFKSTLKIEMMCTTNSLKMALDADYALYS